MSRTRAFKALLGASIALLSMSQAAWAYSLTLGTAWDSAAKTRASDGVGANSSETLTVAALPYAGSSTSTDGATSASADYAISDSEMLITFNHFRAPGVGVGSTFSDGLIYFDLGALDGDVSYSITGSYSLTDSVGNFMELYARIYDLTLGTEVFLSHQRSAFTPNESFTLGLAEGDIVNNSWGNTAGTLIAGHSYSLQYYVQNLEGDGLTSGTGSGFVRLALTSYVPEPSTGALLGIGLACMALKRRDEVDTITAA